MTLIRKTSGGLLLKLTHFLFGWENFRLDGCLGIDVTLEPVKVVLIHFFLWSVGIYDHCEIRETTSGKIRLRTTANKLFKWFRCFRKFNVLRFGVHEVITVFLLEMIINETKEKTFQSLTFLITYPLECVGHKTMKSHPVPFSWD